MNDNGQAFDQLRSILLSQDKEELYRINDELRHELLHKINDLQIQLDDPEVFSHKISSARSQIVDILGPVMGRMIKKYIQTEIEKLNQQIKTSTNKFTSKISFFDKLKRRNPNISIKDFEKTQLNEILLIAKQSGLLIAKYSRIPIADPEVVAGMFTAIKSFMETVFDTIESEIGLIDYTDYKILIHQYGTYYFAVIFRGANDPNFKEDIINKLDNFSEHHLQVSNPLLMADEQSKIVERQMHSYFKNCYERNKG